jgi:hypothetical protein
MCVANLIGVWCQMIELVKSNFPDGLIPVEIDWLYKRYAVFRTPDRAPTLGVFRWLNCILV